MHGAEHNPPLLHPTWMLMAHSEGTLCQYGVFLPSQCSPGGSVLSETGSGALGKSGLSPHTRTSSRNGCFSELEEETSPPSPSSPRTKNCAWKREVRMNSAMTSGVGIAGGLPSLALGK